MDKQLNLLYFSPTGTTAKVVKELGISISYKLKEYDITLPNNRQENLIFGCNDIVVVGVPVYAGRVPEFLINYFGKVKGNGTPAIFIVVYGNRDYDDALLELKDIFEKNGFIGIAGCAFIGEHSYTTKVGTGRPDINDLKTAIKFGMEIKAKLNSNLDYIKTTGLNVKGKFPYRERIVMSPAAPETNDMCIKCGACAKYCPTGAIDLSDFMNIDAAKCICCCSCIKRCPVDAKYFDNEAVKKSAKMLIDNFSKIRHEPELFI